MQLTPKQREAWELHLAGMSGRAIAKRLGVAESNVRQRLKMARRHAEADPSIQGAMSSVGMQDAGPLHSGWIKSEGASLYFQMPKGQGGASIEDIAEHIIFENTGTPDNLREFVEFIFLSEA